MEKEHSLISFEHTTFRYDGQDKDSLKDINLEIHPGEFLVFTGQSGCGKTTMTRCINNLIPGFFEGRLSGDVIVSGHSITESDAGEAGKEIASIFQDPRSQFFTTNSSSEVAFASENYGVPHEDIISRVDTAFRELHMEKLKNRDIFSLSSGERQKIAFLAATTLNPEIYVLDEPSANLDIHTIWQIREHLLALKNAGHTIIVSEHRLFYLYGLTDRFVIMKEGRVMEVLTGNEMASLSGEEMRSRKLRPLKLDTIQIAPKEQVSRKDGFFEIRNLSFAYKNTPELIHRISIQAEKGETIALIGENGSGKTTLGKIISGLIRANKGTFIVDGKRIKQRKLSDYGYFVMQEADHQLYTSGVTDELRLGNEKVPQIEEKISFVLKMLHLYKFKDAHPYALSGGQKQRLTIGAAMLSEKPILVLDEPTSGLDWENMYAVAEAVNYLRNAGKLIFVITHDPEFLSLTASRALLMEAGMIKEDLSIVSEKEWKIINRFMMQEGGE
ncbi:MAG: energy-coupling factor ABC transporter ATP-binding protein [Lachnospiraceae bacterium]|nr:energy-coupling factor ABC transporter ATP-binding protein [Lachnospiraceae bacterium]